MNSDAALRKTFATSPMLAAAGYAGLLFALLFTVITSVVDILGQRFAVASSASMLEQLEGRRPAAARGGNSDAQMPSGSVFLDGATITVAGAALIQRVAGAVTKFGGNVLSTQVELKGTQDTFFQTFAWAGFKERVPKLLQRGIGKAGEFELNLGRNVGNL